MLKGITLNKAFGFTVVFLISTGIFWYFHNRFISASDDAVFALVARELLLGKILNVDVISFHSGLIHFLHTGAFYLWGVDFVSLRYPLLCVGIAQSLLVYVLFIHRGIFTAVTASLISASSGIVLFNNPTNHWYCSFLLFVLILVLQRDIERKKSLKSIAFSFFVGILLGSVFLFRQLTFMFLSYGVLTLFLVRPRTHTSVKIPMIRFIVFILYLPLFLFLISSSQPDGLLLFSLLPLLIVYRIIRFSSPERMAKGIVSLFPVICGGMFVILSYMVFISFYGSLSAWLEQTFILPFQLASADFKSKMFFLYIPLVGYQEIIKSSFNYIVIFNTVLWSFFLVVPLMMCLFLIRRAEERLSEAVFVLPIFYSLVALHYEIPIYLIFTLAPILISFFWFYNDYSKVYSLMFAFSVISGLLFFHAGQPIERGVAGRMRGERVALSRCDLPRCSLFVSSDFAGKMKDFTSFLEDENSTIFAFPYSPEFYFLFDKSITLGSFHFTMDVRDRGSYRQLLQRFKNSPPHFIIYSPHDKYLTPYAKRFWQRIRDKYSMVVNVDDTIMLKLK